MSSFFLNLASHLVHFHSILLLNFSCFIPKFLQNKKSLRIQNSESSWPERFLLVEFVLQRVQELATEHDVVRQSNTEGVFSGHVVQQRRPDKTSTQTTVLVFGGGGWRFTGSSRKQGSRNVAPSGAAPASSQISTPWSPPCLHLTVLSVYLFTWGGDLSHWHLTTFFSVQHRQNPLHRKCMEGILIHFRRRQFSSTVGLF